MPFAFCIRPQIRRRIALHIEYSKFMTIRVGKYESIIAGFQCLRLGHHDFTRVLYSFTHVSTSSLLLAESGKIISLPALASIKDPFILGSNTVCKKKCIIKLSSPKMKLVSGSDAPLGRNQTCF